MNDRVETILKHSLTVPVVTGVVSFAAGAVSGYFFARRKRFDIHVVDHVDFDAKDDDRDGHSGDDKEARVRPEPATVVIEERVVTADTSQAVRDFLERQAKEKLENDDDEEAVTETEVLQPLPQPYPEVAIPRNAFANGGWDYEEELKTRSTSAPYVLHADEFHADEKGYTQLSITYYAGDDILADTEDKMVYNYHDLVGDLKFGHGSGDPNVVFVRNDANRVEYEIFRSDDEYVRVIEGLEPEPEDIRHSAHKFRDVD